MTDEFNVEDIFDVSHETKGVQTTNASEHSYPALSSNMAMQQIKEQVQILFKSQFKPQGMTQMDALTICFHGHELGMGPMESLTSLYSAKGRIGFYATAMRKRVFQLLPDAVFEIEKWNEEICVVRAARPGQKGNYYEFTIEEAKNANLLRNPVWGQYRKDMLYARATSRACRAEFPDALGVYKLSAEEIKDLPTPKEDRAADLNEQLAERGKNGTINEPEPGNAQG